MKKLFPIYVRIPLLFFFVFGMMEYFIDSGDRPAFIKYPMVSVFLLFFLFLIIAIDITLTSVNHMLYQIMTEEQKKQLEEVSSAPISETEWYKNLMKWLTKSEPIENNDQVLLDHDYDGIKELDNKLPPWWVYLFYICIVFAGIYLIRYEIMGGDNPEMELKKEMAQAKIDVENYLKTAPDLMDESKVTQLTEPADIAAGKEIYTANCVACHRADGGGQIGPNLTDEHWILGGGIKNIFHTLEHGGRDGKGMISWKGTLKPKEMQKVASYILTLQGTNPKDAKPAEGEVWVAENTVKKDSTTVTK
jgi:cytochrome c oxidase cbb3-type subunit III